MVCRRSCPSVVKDGWTCVCIASKESMKSKVKMHEQHVDNQRGPVIKYSVSLSIFCKVSVVVHIA